MTNIHEITSERHESIDITNFSVESLRKSQDDRAFRFRLAGAPPNQAIKLIQINPEQSIAEVKKTVQREFKLNPILDIHFIIKGKVLRDNLKFAKLGAHPRKDIITVMAIQGGGFQ